MQRLMRVRSAPISSLIKHCAKCRKYSHRLLRYYSRPSCGLQCRTRLLTQAPPVRSTRRRGTMGAHTERHRGEDNAWSNPLVCCPVRHHSSNIKLNKAIGNPLISWPSSRLTQRTHLCSVSYTRQLLRPLPSIGFAPPPSRNSRP